MVDTATPTSPARKTRKAAISKTAADAVAAAKPRVKKAAAVAEKAVKKYGAG